MTATAAHGRRAARNRLSISALLLWMLGVAIGIRAYQSLLPDLQDEFDSVAQGYALAMGFAAGTILELHRRFVWRPCDEIGVQRLSA